MLYIGLRQLYTESLFLPRVHRDGRKSVNECESSKSYYAHLKNLCVRYVDLINTLCSLDSRACAELDKPNLHRVVELYHHSIPRYGHMSVIDELKFEAAHQPLKRSLSRSNHKHGHNYSIRNTLANEWRLRMGRACASISVEDDQDLSDEQCRQLIAGCFGDCSSLNNGTISIEDVRSSFIPPVVKEFKKYCPDNTSGSTGAVVWSVRKKFKEKRGRGRGIRSGRISEHFHDEDEAIRSYLQHITSRGDLSASVASYATAIRSTPNPEAYNGVMENNEKLKGKSETSKCRSRGRRHSIACWPIYCRLNYNAIRDWGARFTDKFRSGSSDILDCTGYL